MTKRPVVFLTISILAALLFTACDIAQDTIEDVAESVEDLVDGEQWEEEYWDAEEEASQSGLDNETDDLPMPKPMADLPLDLPISNKWDLWTTDETLLRGANIWQSVVVPDLDGPTFKGSGRVGPPYSQDDFNALAELGANYVTISGPGLFTEERPFRVDDAVVDHMDHLLEMIAQADMFVTISFRTGPGRSEYGLCCDEEDPFFSGYFNDTVWEDSDAQNAWIAMWKYMAERYRDNPIVVGYKLMVEPNAAPIYFDVWEPDELDPDYAHTIYDWNQFYPRIVEGIREVDHGTPILVSAEGFSAIHWVPYLKVLDVPNLVYVAHQYAPYDGYTHQSPGGKNSYPDNFDIDDDGNTESFDRDWLEDLLSPLDKFAADFSVPVSVDEFGVNRWIPGAARYMDDIMGLFEARGMNYSLWEWQTSWPEFAEDVLEGDRDRDLLADGGVRVLGQ